MHDIKAKNMILIGYSGHGMVVAEAALLNKANLVGYVDKKIKKKNLFSLEYFGDENDPTSKVWSVNGEFILGIGDNFLRSKIANKFCKAGKKIVNVFHPEALISPYSQIESGVFVARNACINPGVFIKRHSIINTGAIIEHECIIDESVHIAPGAVLAGNVKVGNLSFVGANSVIKEGVNIGTNVVVGAGSVVISDIKDNATVYGNPAKIK